jgi:hypothetical protein
MVKLTERVCEACGTHFTTSGAGRPPKLCPACRATDIIGTVRVVRLPETGNIRIQQRRPGKKTKFVNTDLTPEEARDLMADLGFKLAGVTKVPAVPAGPEASKSLPAPRRRRSA